MRVDWEDIINDDLVQVNLSISYPGIIRAWHRHVKGQTDYFCCIKGAIKVCTYNDQNGELFEYVMTGERPELLRIQGKYWHGFKVIGNNPAWLLYFVNKLYNYEFPDEERRPWNDQKIIPLLINGEINDNRVNKPWDWNFPPNK